MQNHERTSKCAWQSRRKNTFLLISEMGKRKKRTTFTIVDKAQALDLLDALEENGTAVLKLDEKSKKKKKKYPAQCKVFTSKKEIGLHYNVGKSTISGLVGLPDETKQKIRERAASIKKNRLDEKYSRLQVVVAFFVLFEVCF